MTSRLETYALMLRMCADEAHSRMCQGETLFLFYEPSTERTFGRLRLSVNEQGPQQFIDKLPRSLSRAKLYDWLDQHCKHLPLLPTEEAL